MNTIRQALTRATFQSAYRAIRAAQNPHAAWSDAFDGMPFMARSAAVDMYLCKANSRPAMNLADRLYNYKIYKLIGI